MFTRRVILRGIWPPWALCALVLGILFIVCWARRSSISNCIAVNGCFYVAVCCWFVPGAVYPTSRRVFWMDRSVFRLCVHILGASYFDLDGSYRGGCSASLGFCPNVSPGEHVYVIGRNAKSIARPSINFASSRCG